jgi:hypothetical protein
MGNNRCYLDALQVKIMIHVGVVQLDHQKKYIPQTNLHGRCACEVKLGKVVKVSLVCRLGRKGWNFIILLLEND